MPTITISTDTYNSLKELAEPLEDSHDSLLKKLMTVYRNQAPPQRARVPSERRRPAEQPGMRAPRGAVTSRPVYRATLVDVLEAAGGELETRKAIEGVGQCLEKQFKPLDLAALPSGEERWVNAVRFARNDLIEQGKLDDRAPHGVWRLKR